MPLPTMTEKKRAITVILERMKGGASGTESGGTGYKKTSETEADKPRSDASAAKSGAMTRFLSAVEQKNPDEMASALETFYELCSMKEEEDEKEEEYT